MWYYIKTPLYLCHDMIINIALYNLIWSTGSTIEVESVSVGSTDNDVPLDVDNLIIQDSYEPSSPGDNVVAVSNFDQVRDCWLFK